MINRKNECAFPADNMTMSDGGMTIREYFAAKAMQGFISKQEQGSINFQPLSDASVMAADALIKALEEKEV